MHLAKDSPIDENPNTNGGKRIFPGATSSNDNTDRRIVEFEVQIEPKMADCKIYLNWYDVDDPSDFDDGPGTYGGDSNAVGGIQKRYSGIL